MTPTNELRRHLRWICLAGAAVAGGVQADGNSNSDQWQTLDIEISIVEPGATPDQVINRIPLPPPVVTDVNTDIQSDMTPATTTESEAIESALDDIQRTTDQVAEDAARSVSDSVSDAISTGDISELPKDITDALPGDAVNDLVDDVSDNLPEGDELPDPVLDQALDELEDSLDDAEGSLQDAEGSLQNAEGSLQNAEDTLNQAEGALDQVDDATRALQETMPADTDISPELPEPNLVPEDLGGDYQNALDGIETEAAPEIEVPLNQDEMIDQDMIDEVQPAL